jgi:hypothetical protein
MKTVAWSALAVVCAVVITVVVCRWHPHRPKRVWVSYSEKYQDKTIGRKQEYEKVEEDRVPFAEEELSTLIANNKTCMVVTHDEKQADYRVNISVSRFMGDPSMYGEANLTIVRPNGDVFVEEHFFQDNQSKEDIARQPITRAWTALCNSE